MLAALFLAAAPVTLAINAPVGAKYAMDLTFTMKGVGGGGWIKVASIVRETLTKKEGANNWWATKYDITKTDGAGELRAAVKTFQDLENLDMAFLKNRQNQIVKAKVNGTEIPGSAFKGNSDVTFPAKPVSVGTTWTGKLDLGGNIVDIQFRFDGPKSYSGKAAYLITGRVSDPSIKTTKPYAFYVEKGTCKTLFSEGAARLTTQGKTLDVSFSIKRRKN